MSNERKLFAQACSLAYDDPRERYETIKKYDLLKGYTIVDEYNGSDYVLIINKAGFKIYAIRGTEFKASLRGVRDIFEDINITFDKKVSLRTIRLSSVLNEIIHTYGSNRLVLTGHSLGSKIASSLSNEFGLPAVVFNTGSSLLEGMKVYKNVVLYTTNDIRSFGIDLLSISSVLKDDYKRVVVVDKKKGISIHALQNFL